MAIIHKTNKTKQKIVASEWNCEDRDRWPVGEPETSASHPSEREGGREGGGGESGRVAEVKGRGQERGRNFDE